MKKMLFSKKMALLLTMTVVSGMAFTGCGKAKTSTDNKEMVYAVEAGSAGEAAAEGEGLFLSFRCFPGRCPDGGGSRNL